MSVKLLFSCVSPTWWTCPHDNLSWCRWFCRAGTRWQTGGSAGRRYGRGWRVCSNDLIIEWRRAAAWDDAPVWCDAHTDESWQGQVHHCAQEQHHSILQEGIWRMAPEHIFESSSSSYFRFARSAMTMEYHMIAPLSCTMGQRHSPRGTGPWHQSQV